MRVIGLDMSLTNTGVAVLGPDETRLYSFGSKTVSDGIKERWDRFNGMIDKLPEIRRDDLVVIEQPAFSKTTGKSHDRSGLWWFTVDFALQCGALVTEVPPSTLKKYVTGNGTAGKSDVMAAMIRRMIAVDTELVIHNDDESDALGLACMGARHLGHPVDGDLPKKNLEAMAAVRWAS